MPILTLYVFASFVSSLQCVDAVGIKRRLEQWEAESEAGGNLEAGSPADAARTSTDAAASSSSRVGWGAPKSESSGCIGDIIGAGNCA